MDTVFIDTSIFEANNFLEGKRITEVYKLAERGDMVVVIPKLTYDEIINRISKNIDEANQKFKKYREDTRILRNAPSLFEKFEGFDGEKIKEEVSSILNQRFNQSKFIIIDYPTLNIEEVFKSYFERKFPFCSAGKKSEFPDAFALKSIEIWAQEKGVKVLAFSKDGDILNYKSEHLEMVQDFELYLSDKIKEIEGARHKKRLDQIEDIIKNHSGTIKDAIRNWTESQLDDDSKYYDYSNYYDIHDITILEIKIDIEDFNITNVSDEYISVELKVAINYRVEIIIDDEEYMYKDDDTKEWIFLETKPIWIDEVRYVDVDLIFDIDPEGDKVYEPEIETINEGRELNV